MLQPYDQIPTWMAGNVADAAQGERPFIHPTAFVRNSHLGAWTYVGAYTFLIGTHLADYSYIAQTHAYVQSTDLGKFVSVAAGVRINPPNHPMDWVTNHQFTYCGKTYRLDKKNDKDFLREYKTKRVVVDHDVWIGHGAIIMPGVHIQTGAVVGGGAVVTKDVAPYQIVAGVPAKPIRNRFDERTIEKLLNSRWWEWDHQTLKNRLPLFKDVDRFVDRYG